MAAFRVSSGGLDKNITTQISHELAAIEALTQWVICTTCTLGEVLSVIDSDDEEVWFHTETLLVSMGVDYKVNKKRIFLNVVEWRYIVC